MWYLILTSWYLPSKMMVMPLRTTMVLSKTLRASDSAISESMVNRIPKATSKMVTKASQCKTLDHTSKPLIKSKRILTMRYILERSTQISTTLQRRTSSITRMSQSRLLPNLSSKTPNLFLSSLNTILSKFRLMGLSLWTRVVKIPVVDTISLYRLVHK